MDTEAGTRGAAALSGIGADSVGTPGLQHPRRKIAGQFRVALTSLKIDSLLPKKNKISMGT